MYGVDSVVYVGAYGVLLGVVCVVAAALATDLHLWQRPVLAFSTI